MTSSTYQTRVKIIILSLLGSIILGCADRSIFQEPETIRMEKIISNSSPQEMSDSLRTLDPRLGHFWDVFSQNIIRIGHEGDTIYNKLLVSFQEDPVIQRSIELSDSVFGDFAPFKKKIRRALAEAESFLPGSANTMLVTYVSGFNESFVTLPDLLGIGLDNFLGAQTLFYKQLGIPEYIRQSMDPDHLASEAIRAWLLSEINPPGEDANLLQHMIYHGKIYYIMDEIMKRTDPYILFRYTPAQWEWAKAHEEAAWKFLAQEKLLFTTNRLDIRRFTDEAPFVREFGKDSPGRMGDWIGYRIIGNYVKRTHCSINELIDEADVTKILEKARYNP